MFSNFIKFLNFLFPATMAQFGAATFTGMSMTDQQKIDEQALYQARVQIEKDEGNRLDVYYDGLGRLTVGIGHLVQPRDALIFGQRITPSQVDAFFRMDIQKAFDAGRDQALELGKYEIFMIAALTAVNFQLGTNWRGKFKNTWNDLKNGNAQSAINRLNSSSWKQQTPNRVASFVSIIQQEYA